MKILYGITKSNFGGAQRYVYELSSEMKRQGHDVVVLYGGEGSLVKRLKEQNIRIITLSYLKRDISIVGELRSFYFIFHTLFNERPDVFHTNSSKMGGIGNLAGRLAGVKKIIFTSHGWAFNEPRPGWQKIVIKFLVWITILLSHKTICVSEKTKSQVSSWPFTKKKLVVIHNGISRFDLDQRRDQSFTVGTIAELHRIKGLDILLTAWSKFVKRPIRTTVQSGGHEAKLVIIGDGEEKTNLQNMAKELDISDSVVFKGFVENARALLSSFDIFVLPSRSEAMPYALLEAGMAGIPVIATSVGGIPEIIENGLNGVLMPTENDEVLLSSLILLAEDKSLRERLGTNLKHSIQENFSFEKMVGNTLQTYL